MGSGSGGSAISIHAPHTGRDLADKTVCATLNRISIHAPHTGRDGLIKFLIKVLDEFQSTRPIRGATKFTRNEIMTSNISIHAPHTGRD